MMDIHKLLRDAPKGEVTIDGGKMRVVFRRHYAKPVARVWAALTTPERLADWFGDAELDLRVDGKMILTFGRGQTMEMGISRLDPPHLLAWIWEIDGVETEVLFELAAEGDGCALTLTHSGINARGPGPGVRAGWHAHLEGLADSLEGRATPVRVKEQREAAVDSLYPAMPGA